MKKIITVISLDTAKDPISLQPRSGLVLSYKTESGSFERLELDISQFDAMTMLNIKNLADIAGKKYEIDTDGKAIKSILEVDTRSISYKDIEEIKRAIGALQNAFASFAGKQQPQQNQPKTTIKLTDTNNG